MKALNVEPIQVCIRMRPLLPPYETEELWVAEPSNNLVFTLTSQNASLLNVATSALRPNDRKLKYFEAAAPQSFSFDCVFGQEASSQEVYHKIARPIVHRVLNGYNGTICMYGQTTSGKTYTMLGEPSNPGVLPCALRDIFSQAAKDTQREFRIWVSYLEIYNEQINDLLNPGNNNLRMKEDPLQGIVVEALTQQQVYNFEDVFMLMNYGEEHRAYRETSIHEHSSRSHTIFKVYIESCGLPYSFTDGRVRFSCLNLVDLAGSERLSELRHSPGKAGEVSHINKSLFVLTHVVNKLAEGKHNYIHYRDSKLTRLLSMALGGNSMCAIVCTISPASVNFQQTLSTLRFASQAKRIRNTPQLNEVLNEAAEISEYKNQVVKLHHELKHVLNENVSLEEQNSELSKQIRALQSEVKMKNETIAQLQDSEARNRQIINEMSDVIDNERQIGTEQKRGMTVQFQELMEKYSEERRLRNKLESSLQNYRQVLIQTIRSEHGTLKNLNTLFAESGDIDLSSFEKTEGDVEEFYPPAPKHERKYSSSEVSKKDYTSLQNKYKEKLRNISDKY